MPIAPPEDREVLPIDGEHCPPAISLPVPSYASQTPPNNEDKQTSEQFNRKEKQKVNVKIGKSEEESILEK